MYFPDLSPYSYATGRDVAGVLAVGWLERGQHFATGPAPEGLLERLRLSLRVFRCHQFRGFHRCDLCIYVPGVSSHGLLNVLDEQGAALLESHGSEVHLGYEELWVPGPNETFFAAPTLILHYVEWHSYLPPRPFIDALMKPFPESWDAEARCRERLLGRP